MRQIKGTPLPLGVTVKEDRINFSVAVPEGKECRLLLYPSGSKVPCESILMTDTVGEVRYLAMENLDINSYEYNYEIDGAVTIDPYVKALSGKEEWGKQTSLQQHEVRGLLCSKDYDWEGDTMPQIPCQDVVAYSLHVRGFTKDPGSKVKKKGTFEGVIEKIPYLKELGINQIHCMPVYEFEECGLYRNYWGYGPACCFTPKNAYSAQKDGVKSLKDMVKACHRAGIEVVLEMPFDNQIPKQLMEECLRYYMMEYHIDGFIVNPMIAPLEGIRQDPILKKTKILHHQTGFQNVMRRFLKGDEGMVPDVMYWLRHTSGEEGIFNYITNQTGFTLNDLVSYDGKHNEKNGENNRDGTEYNFSWNCGAEGPSRKKEITELRKRQTRNAFFLTILAQGTPCILSGDEFRNSQKGNNNVYCQDNPIGWVNWKNLEKEQELFNFVKRLIQIRKEHRVFCPEKEMQGTDRIGCGMPDVSYHGESAWRVPSEVSSRQLGVYYSGIASGEEDCFVAYNMHWLEHTFALPSLAKNKKWYLLISTDEDTESIKCLKNQRYIELKARTIAVLIGR
ncbi:MAG: alpha-amylase family glycosyl hydrolase [Lachnospiraceae bacterium]